MIRLLYTDSEVSEMLALTPRQVASLSKRHGLPSLRLPNKEVRYDAADVARWVESLKQPDQEQEPGQ